MAFIKLTRIDRHTGARPREIFVAVDKIIQVERPEQREALDRGVNLAEGDLAGAVIFTPYENFPVVEAFNDLQWTLNPNDILPNGVERQPAPQAIPVPPRRAEPIGQRDAGRFLNMLDGIAANPQGIQHFQGWNNAEQAPAVDNRDQV